MSLFKCSIQTTDSSDSREITRVPKEIKLKISIDIFEKAIAENEPKVELKLNLY